jgi:hypothetical protein
MLTRGVDLEELFETLSADRMLNVMDTIIVEDITSGAMIEGGTEKIRTKLLSVYNAPERTNDEVSGYRPGEVKPMPNYIQPDDDGFAGLEAPLG